MSKLPIREIVMYKHGVGFFVREGETDDQEIALSFRADEINDVLKSLTVFDRAGGRIVGIHYQTPIDKTQRLAESGLNLSEFGGLRDLMRDLRGRGMSITYNEADKGKTLVGRMVGVESQNKGDEKVVILANDGQVRVIPFDDVRSFRITDDQVSKDLSYFLDSSVTEENRRSVSVRLTEGNHQLVVYYIAPSPTWRVSYRVVAEGDKNAPTGNALLQGWGLIDNRLDEDLEDIRLTLIAGQPISFIYDLAESRVPHRPTIKDTSRQAIAPMEFGAGSEFLDEPMGGKAYADREIDQRMRMVGAAPSVLYAMSPEAAAKSAHVQTQTSDMGELFQYLVMTPVSVKRGESALVPIISTSLKYQRELLYNGDKNSNNPVVALRFDNIGDLTLERGPVTVVEDSTYKGEAIVPFTKAKGQLYLPFAVELNIKVREETTASTHFAGLHFQNHFVVEQWYNVTTYTYHIENLTGKPQFLTLEETNLINSTTELFETPAPISQTLDDVRWQISLPEKGIVQWVIKTRMLRQQWVEVRKVTYDKLNDYLKNRFLDDAKVASLKEVIDTIALIKNLKDKKAKTEAERTTLFAQNEEWRKNLAVLQASTSDDSFRTRLLKQLEESDDRVTLINRELRATDAKISACEKRIEQLIGALPSGS
jgi:hypothetical protein